VRYRIQKGRNWGRAPRQEEEAAEKEAGGTVEWVRRHLGFEPDALQARVLESEAKRGLLNCTRQWGKSTITAAKAVHRAWGKAGSLVLVVSPSGRQSGEFLRKASGFARKLGSKRKGGEMALEFENGSRIVGLPGSEETVRGFSAVDLVLVDEAARVPEELYKATRPMLAVSDGTLWLMSTPWGKQGFFWEAWHGTAEDWERIRVPATECPRISRAFLEGERATLGDRWFRQEYMCEFGDAEDAVFGRGLIDRAISNDIAVLDIR
jgi:phage FluMu gp28-like protein